MKNLMKFAAMFFAAVTLVACFPSGGTEDPTPQTKDVAFSVAVNSVGEGVATLTVSHNGAETDTWYGFLTTDTKKGDLSLVYEKVAEVNATDLSTGTSKTVELTGLALGTDYKYVVFGIGTDMAIYGTAGSVTFKTEDGRSMSKNNDWTISYIGDQEYQGEMYYNCINIAVPENDTTTYYYDVVSVEDWALVEAELYAYAEQLVPAMKAYVTNLNNAYGTSYTWQDMLSSGSAMYSLGDLDPGQYVSFMVGINTDETLTRTYAASAAFEVKEQEASAAYTAWLGNWMVEGQGYSFNEAGDGLVLGDCSFEIVLSKYVNNKSCVLEGWAGFPVGILVDYYPQYDAFTLAGQLAAEGVEFSDGSTANIYFVGVGSDGNLYAQGEFATVIADQTGAVKIYPYEEEGFAITQLTFIGEFEDGLYYVTDVIPTGVMSMSKLAAPAAAPVKEAGLFNFEGRLQKPATFVKGDACHLQLIK